MKNKIVEAAAQLIEDNYVFADKGKEIARALRALSMHFPEPAGPVFSDALVESLRNLSGDKHFFARFHPEGVPEVAAVPEPMQQEFLRAHNFGIKQIRSMTGNVGYLDLRFFAPLELGGETLAAAMALLTGSEAIIFDLRWNGGGDPATVAFLCSYLFPATPVHLNDIWCRTTNKTTQFWTHAFVPGRRLPSDKDVFVLTSPRTFSGGEEFSYDLKVLQRATLVGEPTGGGAHPGDVFRLSSHFSIFIPTGRPTNPITKSNWEGTGVHPDVPVAAADALRIAYGLALEKILGRTTGAAAERVKIALEAVAEEAAAAEPFIRYCKAA